MQSLQYKMDRTRKQVQEKENQQRFVNKKTDLLASLHNIKLPLRSSSQFHSLPALANSIELIPSSKKSIDSVSILPTLPLTPTEDYCRLYGKQVQSTFMEEKYKGKFLSKHKIDGNLRARMLDWMVEVMCSYSFKHKTYFAGVEIMDRFFAASEETILPNQLHIIGVQSMFIASKMQEVYPLKMKTIFDKIAHKKIPITDLVKMQQTIIETLNFKLTSSTFFDLALTKITLHLCKNQKYNDKLLNQIEENCSCLAKFMCYNYTLVSQCSKQMLANALVKCTLNLNQINWKDLSEEQENCRVMIEDTIRNFRRSFKGMNNLFKFADKTVLQKIEESLL